MTDTIDPPPGQRGNALAGGDIIGLDVFEAAAWEAPIADLNDVDCRSLCDAFGPAAQAALERQDHAAATAFQLLRDVCFIHLDTGDPARPFRPGLMMDGMRSADAIDYAGPQAEVFEALAAETQNPGLRARLADVAWFNRRRSRAAADTAVDGYVAAAAALLDGTVRPSTDLGSAVSFEQVKYLQRGLEIARRTRKAEDMPANLVALARRSYERARDAGEYVVTLELAKLMVRFDIVPFSDLAAQAESVADAGTATHYLFPRKGLYFFAGEAFGRSGDADAARRVRLKAVDLGLAESRANPMALNRAHALRTAIAELRRIPGTQDQRRSLEDELLKAQRESAMELRVVRGPGFDVSDVAEATLAAFSALNVPKAMLELALLSRPRDPEALQAEAMDSARRSPLSGLFASLHTDGDGKVLGERPAVGLGESSEPEWLKGKVFEVMALERQMIAQAQLRPVLDALANEVAIYEPHFAAICHYSPFVPPGHADIFAQGFARLFQGDMIGAVHILVPQMEAGVRHVLATAGGKATMIRPDMTQEDRSLSALFETERELIDQIFSPGFALEIEAVFLERTGPALRHTSGHGKLTLGRCFSPDALYACWMVYVVTCWPLLAAWEELIAPHIESHLI